MPFTVDRLRTFRDAVRRAADARLWRPAQHVIRPRRYRRAKDDYQDKALHHAPENKER